MPALTAWQVPCRACCRGASMTASRRWPRRVSWDATPPRHVLRSREREKVAAGRMRVVREKPFLRPRRDSVRTRRRCKSQRVVSVLRSCFAQSWICQPERGEWNPYARRFCSQSSTLNSTAGCAARIRRRLGASCSDVPNSIRRAEGPKDNSPGQARRSPRRPGLCPSKKPTKPCKGGRSLANSHLLTLE